MRELDAGRKRASGVRAMRVVLIRRERCARYLEPRA